MLLIGDAKLPGCLPDDFGNLRMVDEPDAVKPDIEVRQVSEKRIKIYSRDDRKQASHRPRGRLSRRIGIWELHDMLEANQWERDYYPQVPIKCCSSSPSYGSANSSAVRVMKWAGKSEEVIGISARFFLEILKKN